MKRGFIFFILTLGVIVSCSKSSDYGSTVIDCTNVSKSFSADVNPVIQSTCTVNSGCHGSGSIQGPGELLNYTQIFNARASIRTAVATGTMPKIGNLTTTEKSSIICWIDNGAPND